MQIALVGLGRMGGNMARRLLRGGHEIVAYDRDADAVEAVRREGASSVASLEELRDALKAPRVVWLMLPMAPLEHTIATLSRVLEAEDIVVDGGNSNPRDSLRRSRSLAERGIRFVDCGTSGGVWGLENGYCLMVGGAREAFDRLVPALTTLSAPGGFMHAGPSGAGHFAKMVHNGIEYAMMQAYAEGFELLSASEFGFDLHRLAETWNRGSVVRSWLLELAERGLAKDPDLSELKPWVDDSGMGRWTVQEAVAHGVPVPAISAALFARFASRQDNAFGLRLIAALRNEFGGHAVKKA